MHKKQNLSGYANFDIQDQLSVSYQTIFHLKNVNEMKIDTGEFYLELIFVKIIQHFNYVSLIFQFLNCVFSYVYFIHLYIK